jgi:hypothetical protein
VRGLGKPTRKGLRGKLLTFFAENPQEELTPADVIVKFDAHPRTVHNTLSRMAYAGELTKRSVYCLAKD